MIKKFFEKDSVLKISSFVIAIVVWLYVIYIEDPKIKITIDDIPVNYKIAELSSDLALVSYDIRTIDVEVEANRSEIVKLDVHDFEAYLDLSSVSESGKYDDVKIKVSCFNKNVDVLEMSDDTSTVQIEDIITKKFSVEVEMAGDVSDGYAVISKPAISLETVVLTGPKKYVEAVKTAFVKVDCNGLTESKTFSSEIYLKDNNNAVIDKNHEAYKQIKLSEKRASVDIEVGKTKTVNIVIPDIDGASHTLSPSTLEIYCKHDNINKIYTESISGRLGGSEKTVKLRLIIPKDVIVISGKKDVTVNVKK